MKQTEVCAYDGKCLEARVFGRDLPFEPLADLGHGVEAPRHNLPAFRLPRNVVGNPTRIGDNRLHRDPAGRIDRGGQEIVVDPQVLFSGFLWEVRLGGFLRKRFE